MTQKKNGVAKKGSSEVGMFDSSMGTGFEGTDAQTFKTPFLKILQALSPELKKSDPKYIAGAEQGVFCNSATQEIYNDIKVVVLKVEHSLIVWKPDRGGFVGRYHKSEENNIVATKEGMKKWDAEGNEVMDTIEFFCMNADDPSDIFILPLSTASIKHGKAFATRLRLLKMDGKPVNVSWAGVWKLGTTEESNDKGSWYTIGATPEMERFITIEERDNFIKPAMELLKTAETDYSVIGDEDEEENVEY